jgi:phosphoribosylglycinamide formyltransferase 1
MVSPDLEVEAKSMPESKVSPVRAVFLISGSGSTMENLVECARRGDCLLDPVGVISSKEGVPGVARAQALGLPVQVVNRADYTDAVAFSRQVFKLINAVKPDVVLMAGFLSYLHLPERYKGKVLNIHPSLLPKFGGKNMYGIRVHQAVLKAGETESGCTVHYVDEEYDRGPIILQRKVPVQPDDTPETLQERVQEAEREAYPQAVNLFAERRLMQVAQSVRILPVKAGATS